MILLDIVLDLPAHNIFKRFFLPAGMEVSNKRNTEDCSIQLTGCNSTGFPLKTKFDTIFWRNSIATVMFTCESSSRRTTPFLGKLLPSEASSIGYPLWILSPIERSQTFVAPLLRGSKLSRWYGTKLWNMLFSSV